MLSITIKRIYEAPSKEDGFRILIDRVWPRGVTKEQAKLDEWNKNIAPSMALRKWFDHREERFKEFARRYETELSDAQEDLERIRDIAKNKEVCLLYGAKNEEFNQAVVLQCILRYRKVTKDCHK